MGVKYTIEAIKDLKTKVKYLNGSLLNYYTEDEFQPDNSFNLVTEQSEIDSISPELVQQMCEALENNSTEFEAGKILYEALESLSPKQASDIGFWTFQNHNTFYSYITRRWDDLYNENYKKSKVNYVINHWIQTNSSQADLIDYPISGLWWSFYLSVDNSRSDKYELTKILFKNTSLRTKYFGQARFGRYKPALIGALEFIKENKLDEGNLEQAGRAIYPYINLLGGIRPLTYFGKEWFKEKLEKRFGEQIRNGESLFERPKELENEANESSDNEPQVNTANKVTYKHYFCLDRKTGNYKITSKPESNWTNCIGLDFQVDNQFLIHFYKEGKIKKSLINGNFSNKTLDRAKPYSNGKCPKLSLCDVQLISEPVIFGIAYKTRMGVFFKAMDEQDNDLFRIDNGNLRQEGKKVLYINESFQSCYKILPYNLKGALGTLVQKSPTASGADITNNYYKEIWSTLRLHWPELFSGTINWCDE
jgi:hypothetical protein